MVEKTPEERNAYHRAYYAQRKADPAWDQPAHDYTGRQWHCRRCWNTYYRLLHRQRRLNHGEA
jgi:hypothetical protein